MGRHVLTLLRRRWGWVMVPLAVATLCAAAGCSKKPAGPKCHTVTGTITLRGQPLDGATVLFRAVTGPYSGAGRTDASGRYSLSSQFGEGIPEGEYTVTVTKYEEVASPESEDEVAPPPRLLTPLKYAQAETSGLRAAVKPGPNTIDFDLTD